jgi:hypothetical protein
MQMMGRQVMVTQAAKKVNSTQGFEMTTIVACALQHGQIYNTPRGRAVWTGDRFEVV